MKLKVLSDFIQNQSLYSPKLRGQGVGRRGRGGGAGGGEAHPSGLGVLTNPGEFYYITLTCTRTHTYTIRTCTLSLTHTIRTCTRTLTLTRTSYSPWLAPSHPHLTSPGMACFIGSPLHLTTWIGLDLHLDQTVARGPEHAALDAILANLCQLRRNPLQQPFSPVPLMMGLNAASSCLASTSSPSPRAGTPPASCHASWVSWRWPRASWSRRWKRGSASSAATPANRCQSLRYVLHSYLLCMTDFSYHLCLGTCHK